MRWILHLPYPIARLDEVVPLPEFLCRSRKEIFARPDAADAFQKMAQAAQKNGVYLVAISGWRNRSYQENLFLDAEKRHGLGLGIEWVAPPGFSEHHTGFVLDLADEKHPEFDDEPGFETTDAGRWLAHHAHLYGFELSFPLNNWQNVGCEPWHWRYVGSNFSRRLFHAGVLVFAARLIWGSFSNFCFHLKSLDWRVL